MRQHLLFWSYLMHDCVLQRGQAVRLCQAAADAAGGGAGRWHGGEDKSPALLPAGPRWMLCSPRFVCSHVSFCMQDPSSVETPVCFCSALGVSERAVFRPNASSVGSRPSKSCSHQVGGLRNKPAAVRPNFLAALLGFAACLSPPGFVTPSLHE